MNLLAEQTKGGQRRLRQRRVLTTFGVALFVLELLIAGSLITFTRLIDSDTASIEADSLEEMRRLDSATKRSVSSSIRDLNQQSAAVSQATTGMVAWSPLLATIDQVAPSGMTFQRLSLNGKAKTVSLDGHAATRDDLLTFVERLEQLESISGVQSPIANILQRENVTFTLTATLETTAP